MKLSKTLVICALPLLAACSSDKDAWSPAGDNIMTPWAEEVTPANVHPEYPRPRLIRDRWASLNGLWDYAVTDAGADAMPEADGEILVPFCIESALSGVGRTIGADDALWYKTSFKVPAKWKKQKVRLNFDAVDWQADVFLNGQHLGTHTGGYTAFSYDITPYLVKGRQELTVKVLDATDNDFQPRGKQVSKPSGIWYTAVSGIWQSVWIEPVGQAFIYDYDALADIDEGKLTITAKVDGARDGDVIKAVVKGGGKEFEATLTPGLGTDVAIDGAHLWSVDDPYLYDIDFVLLREGKAIDQVKGYTAMRKVSVMKDEAGHNRLALNNKPIFHYGPLDQGWWPDGLYTPPTDEAMRYDLKITKDFGFNMIRKHIKVEPATWYRACDEMGILVWQDMPCYADNRANHWADNDNDFDNGTDWPATPEIKANYYKEWTEIIGQLKNYPCIAVWVPFNEAWGQFDTKEVAAYTKGLDPTRLVNYASGGNWEAGCPGDILDSHHYPTPKLHVWEDDKANVLGEYGGIGMPVEGHVWNIDRKWGYVKLSDSKAVTDKYITYAQKLDSLVTAGCSAAVYTQTTDVEGEVNGLLTYDRKVIKLDQERVREVNLKVIAQGSKH